MGQKIQTKLNDIAFVCQQHGDDYEPCGYHESRVFCEFDGIEQDLLQDHGESLHTFLAPSAATTKIAKQFCATHLPAGSWYLVKEQRDWLEQQLITRLNAHSEERPFKIMVAGVASYVHAIGQLLIYLQVLAQLENEPPVEITFTDRCNFPLDQIDQFLKAIQSKSFFRYKFELGGKKYKCPAELDKKAREYKEQLNQIQVNYQVGDLTDAALFAEGEFDLITEHFMTSLLYKNFETIQPIRANYHSWLRVGGYLLSADGIRIDSDYYQEFMALNEAVGFSADSTIAMPVWDPYGLPQETFRKILENGSDKRYPVELDNTLSGFRKP